MTNTENVGIILCLNLNWVNADHDTAPETCKLKSCYEL